MTNVRQATVTDVYWPAERVFLGSIIQICAHDRNTGRFGDVIEPGFDAKVTRPGAFRADVEGLVTLTDVLCNVFGLMFVHGLCVALFHGCLTHQPTDKTHAVGFENDAAPIRVRKYEQEPQQCIHIGRVRVRKYDTSHLWDGFRTGLQRPPHDPPQNKPTSWVHEHRPK